MPYLLNGACDAGSSPGLRSSWSIGHFSSGLYFRRYLGYGMGVGYDDILVLSAYGRVGIGTTNPETKLDVNGSFKAQSADITGLLTAQKATIASVLTANALSAQSAEINGLFKAQTAEINGLLKAESAEINGSFNAQTANITGTLTAQSATITGTTILNGNVGIGINPTVKLDVGGTIRATDVRVCLNQGCDFVFEEDYDLMSLSELNKFIKTNKHLPDVAPASQMEAEGINVSEMNALLLRKVEELTLYILGLQKQIDELKKE